MEYTILAKSGHIIAASDELPSVVNKNGWFYLSGALWVEEGGYNSDTQETEKTRILASNVGGFSSPTELLATFTIIDKQGNPIQPLLLQNELEQWQLETDLALAELAIMLTEKR